MLGQDGEVTKLIWNNADNTGDIKKMRLVWNQSVTSICIQSSKE